MMDTIGIGEVLEKLFFIAGIVAALGVAWLVLTVRFVIQDARLVREGRLRGAALRFFLYWFYWVVGLLFVPSIVGVPFVVASIGMRGPRRWGWVLAAVSHAILFVWLVWFMVSRPLPETDTHWAWVSNIVILILHLAGIWCCISRLRDHSNWMGRIEQS